MKFAYCKRDPHKDWGVNDPINLDHCLTFSLGTAEDRQPFDGKEKAYAIHFTMVGCKQPMTWTFVDERHRHWEYGRLTELTYVPNDSEELAAILAERRTDVPTDGPTAEEQATVDLHDAGAAFAENLAEVFGRLSQVVGGFNDRVRQGQRRTA
jgi:hypothetical protein